MLMRKFCFECFHVVHRHNRQGDDIYRHVLNRQHCATVCQICCNIQNTHYSSLLWQPPNSHFFLSVLLLLHISWALRFAQLLIKLDGTWIRTPWAKRVSHAYSWSDFWPEQHFDHFSTEEIIRRTCSCCVKARGN